MRSSAVRKRGVSFFHFDFPLTVFAGGPVNKLPREKPSHFLNGFETLYAIIGQLRIGLYDPVLVSALGLNGILVHDLQLETVADVFLVVNEHCVLLALLLNFVAKGLQLFVVVEQLCVKEFLPNQRVVDFVLEADLLDLTLHLLLRSLHFRLGQAQQLVQRSHVVFNSLLSHDEQIQLFASEVECLLLKRFRNLSQLVVYLAAHRLVNFVRGQRVLRQTRLVAQMLLPPEQGHYLLGVYRSIVLNLLQLPQNLFAVQR
jgi:hypothetical protein